MPAIEAVLFDMDGVLSAYDFDARLQALQGELGVDAAIIREKIFESGFEDKADLGHMTASEYLDGVSTRLGKTVSRAQWLSARVGVMAPDEEMLALARDLQTVVDVAMLTNNGLFLAECIDDVMPSLREVFGPEMYFSGVLGMGKEAAATFTAFCKMKDWRPSRTLFVDDSARYIAEAEKAGLITHHFHGIDGLRDTLRGLGLT